MDPYDHLQVYYVSKGKVKPANRQYSSVRNNYQIHLDSGCAIWSGRTHFEDSSRQWLPGAIVGMSDPHAGCPRTSIPLEGCFLNTSCHLANRFSKTTSPVLLLACSLKLVCKPHLKTMASFQEPQHASATDSHVERYHLRRHACLCFTVLCFKLLNASHK